MNSAGPCSKVAWSAGRPACSAARAFGSVPGHDRDGVDAVAAVSTTRPCTVAFAAGKAPTVPVPIMTRTTALAAPPVRVRERDRGRGTGHRSSVCGAVRRFRTFRGLILGTPVAKGTLVRSAHDRVRS